MIYIYQCLGFFLIPLIKINTLIRIKLGKELLHRHKERYGITKLTKDNSKKVIWIHAASIGEFKSADFLIPFKLITAFPPPKLIPHMLFFRVIDSERFKASFK